MKPIVLLGFDTETTGVDTTKDRIIEIAMIAYEYPSKKPLGKFVRRVNPLQPIDPKAYAVHGISINDLADAPTFEEIAPKIAEILKGVHMLVAHNGNRFDIPLLAAEFDRAGIALPDHLEALDTMYSPWATEDGKLPKLGELCFALGVDYDPEQAHGAAYDVSVMMQAVFNGVERGFFQEVVTLQQRVQA